MISKTLKNRPLTKVLSLCVMAAYAATVFDVAKHDALSLEWCLYLAKGTAIKSIYICSPIAFYGGIINQLIDDASCMAKTPQRTSDVLFNIYRTLSVPLGIVAWLILLAVPALIISECGIIATGGTSNIEALWISVMGCTFPVGFIEGALWFARIFVVFYYLFNLVAPVKIKEEPVIGAGIVGPLKPYVPKKIKKDEKDEEDAV